MKRGYRLRWAGLGAALALTISLVACNLETRHQMLNFFFDGVPPLTPPPVQAAPGPKTEVVTTSDKPTTSTFGVLPELPGAERFELRRVAEGAEGYYHHKMSEKQCRICHDETKGMDTAVEVNQVFCDKCHQEQRLKEGWNHGVINIGQCLPCHQAGHESPYPHMLAKPVAELCLFCHQENTGMDWTPFHKTKALRIDQNNCTTCHDPHRVF